MSDLGGHDRSQELARGLSRGVTLALDDGTPSRSLDGARQAAQQLSLPGLDRLLGALAPYVAGPWPLPLKPVIERVQRVAAECERAGHVDGFRRMDDELGLMARAIERVPLARLGTPSAPRQEPVTDAASVPLADALDGIPGERRDAELMKRVKLRTPVAGALRAALDWLIGGSPARMRMWLASDGSALDVICEGISYTGIQPASEVLASVGAHLGPTGERPGAWTVRVPIRAERETYLMLEQDDLQIAVPWHAVVRVRLIPSDTIEMMLKRQALPVLPPIKGSAHRMAEQPVVVVALGLKRACLVADRLVWRMSAEPAQPPGDAPADGVYRAVRSDDGEVHWVFEPEWLLRNVAAPAMGQPTRTPPPATPIPAPAPVQRRPIPFPAPAAGESGTGSVLPTLAPDQVEPLTAPAREPEAPASDAPASDAPFTMTEAPGAPAPEAAPAMPATDPVGDASEAPHAAIAPRRALVAEDSIAARIYLVRLLEQQGFLVHTATTATELRAMLTRGPWALVCADRGLSDIPGVDLLHDLARSSTAAGAAIVALVSDVEDEAAAHAAGVHATLAKPIDRRALEHLLVQLGHETPAAPSGLHGSDPDPREWGAR
jgi:CheY-like chemotaxis protein